MIRRSIKEITNQLTEILHEDTNAQITVSSTDAALNQLASVLNSELEYLRKERLSMQNRNSELQTAVTNIAHDLRTPLTAISGYLDLLEQEEIEGKPAEYIAVIRERTENLKNLTEELFKYTIISTTADELVLEELPLNDELELALAAAYEALTSRGITPEIIISEKKIIRKIDHNAFQRILANILNNAAKYSDGGLSVSLDNQGTIIISNQAAQLTEVEVGKLFDRFYTVENARESTGLGLSIAKLLSEKMGGQIKAELNGKTLSIILSF